MYPDLRQLRKDPLSMMIASSAFEPSVTTAVWTPVTLLDTQAAQRELFMVHSRVDEKGNKHGRAGEAPQT